MEGGEASCRQVHRMRKEASSRLAATMSTVSRTVSCPAVRRRAILPMLSLRVSGAHFGDVRREMRERFWLTTAPNPRAPRYGFDQGQRGWRTHAVDADPKETGPELKARGAKSACGRTPDHGWDKDLFIKRRCARCILATGSTLCWVCYGVGGQCCKDTGDQRECKFPPPLERKFCEPLPHPRASPRPQGLVVSLAPVGSSARRALEGANGSTSLVSGRHEAPRAAVPRGRHHTRSVHHAHQPSTAARRAFVRHLRESLHGRLRAQEGLLSPYRTLAVRPAATAWTFRDRWRRRLAVRLLRFFKKPLWYRAAMRRLERPWKEDGTPAITIRHHKKIPPWSEIVSTTFTRRDR